MKLLPAIPFLSLLALLSGPASGQERQPGADERAPEGFVLIEEEVIFDLPAGYPDSIMESSRKHFGRKESKASAREMRRVVGFLKGERSRTGAKNDSALAASILELNQLAAALDKDSTFSEKDMKKAFARTHLAIAMANKQRAAQQFASNETRKAGQELRMGSKHVEEAADWADTKLEKSSRDALKEARAVSDKLVKGAGWSQEEVGKGVKNLETEIGRLGGKLEKAKTSEGSASR